LTKAETGLNDSLSPSTYFSAHFTDSKTILSEISDDGKYNLRFETVRKRWIDDAQFVGCSIFFKHSLGSPFQSQGDILSELFSQGEKDVSVVFHLNLTIAAEC
jgi:hypothetical protein